MNNKYSFIGNNCIGACMFSVYGMEFTNPFILSRINIDEFYKFIENFDNINFNNIETIKSIPTYYYGNEERYALNIDNKVIVIYPHFYKDDNYKEPMIINDYCTYCDNPEEVMETNYKRRLSRMKDINKSEFVFVLCMNKEHPSEEETNYTFKIVDLLKKRNNKSIIISPFFEDGIKNNILYISNIESNLGILCGIVKNKIEKYNFL